MKAASWFFSGGKGTVSSSNPSWIRSKESWNIQELIKKKNMEMNMTVGVFFRPVGVLQWLQHYHRLWLQASASATEDEEYSMLVKLHTYLSHLLHHHSCCQRVPLPRLNQIAERRRANDSVLCVLIAPVVIKLLISVLGKSSPMPQTDWMTEPIQDSEKQ
jgi:hypothetical protein